MSFSPGQDRVLVISSTAGTGPLTFGLVVAGYRTLSVAAGTTVPYSVWAVDPVTGNPNGQWETGTGTVSGSVLTRTSVKQSSNGDALVPFSGTLYVTVDWSVADFVEVAAPHKVPYAGDAGTLDVSWIPALPYDASGAASAALAAAEAYTDTAVAGYVPTSRTVNGQALSSNVIITAGSLGAAVTSGTLGQFAATTSAQLAGVISDETGTGALVFAAAPTLTGVVAVGGATAYTTNTATTFTSPQGSVVPTKIGIALYDVGAFGQVLALGIDSTVATTARVVLLCDGRTVEHQPTLNVISPNEGQSCGLTWDGSNTQVRLVSSANLALTVGAVGSRVDVVVVSPTGALLPKGVSAPFGPSGNQNEAYGLGAGRSAATGGQNVGLGPNVLASLTNGNNNNAVGYGAGNGVTSGSDNNLMGNQAGRSISDGNYNSGQGSNALLNVTTGQGNTAIGFDSILRLTTSSYNTGVGFQAGFTPTGSAGPMTLIGSCADNASGYANVIVLVSGSAAAVNAYGANTCTIHAASGTAGDATTLILSGVSSTTNRKTGGIKTSFIVSTDASFTCRLALFAEDSGGDREGIRIDATGSAAAIGFLGAAAVVRQSGSMEAGLVNLGLFSSVTYAPKQLFDHYTSVGNGTTTETDLYSDTLAAGQLANNGEKVLVEYGGTFVSSATATRQVRVYFGGTLIFDTGALTLSLSSAWTCYATLIRVSATVVRYMVSFATEGAALSAYTAVGELTGLTLSATNVLKVTGQAAGVGAATSDIVALLGDVEWKPAA